MTTSNFMTTKSPVSDHRMECMELWGGSSETDTAVAMNGLDARVFSRAYGRGSQGGDVYYFTSCASGRISRVLLADVTGHGDAVAATANFLRDVMRRNVNKIRQSNLMTAINREFGEAVRHGAFATAVVATYFSPTRTLTISTAGHPPPLLYRRAHARWEYFGEDEEVITSSPQDLPFGVDETAGYAAKSATFEHGDLLLTYTDAFIEARDVRGNMLQAGGFLQLVQESPTHTPAEIVPWLVERLEQTADGNLHSDDATLILLQPSERAIPVKDSLLAPFRLLGGVTEVSNSSSTL